MVAAADHAVTEQPVSVAFADGRIVETSDVGETCDWGEVTVWEPPHRLAFTWRVGLPLDQPPTRVEVSFSGDEHGTRVEPTHSGWETYGDRAAQVHARYGAPTGWAGVLDAYARQAAPQASVQWFPR